ncbi:MAG: hypothetical protein M0Z45_06805 [Actinomycetota bacterium]|nr:hypothetical protein [Actinomycetota bacterium]
MAVRPSPNQSTHYLPFWSQLHQGVITVEVCSSCNRSLPYGTFICQDHGIDKVESHTTATRGQLLTHTTIEKHHHPLLDLEAPYSIGVVKEDRFGALIYCRIEGEITDDGCSIALSTRDFGDGVTLVVATPLPESQTDTTT